MESRRGRPENLPSVVALTTNRDKRLQAVEVKSPGAHFTLGDVTPAISVTGGRDFPSTLLRVPIESRLSLGIDLDTVRMFRWTDSGWSPVWNSGVNAELGAVWAKVTQPGTYVGIGLPRDRLLHEVLRVLARERRLLDADAKVAI